MQVILRQHAGRFLFALAFLGCAVFLTRTWPHADPEGYDGVPNYIAIINGVLYGPITNYPYVPSSLTYEAAFKTNQIRVQFDATTDLRRVAYPAPSRPQIDRSTLPYPPNERHILLAAAPPLETTVKPIHGRLLIGIKVPENTSVEMAVEKTDPAGKTFIIMENTPAATIVGAEIFRGTASDAIDTKVPFDKLEFPSTPTPLRVYEDTHVEPQTAYYYKVRLLSRIDVALDQFITEKDPKNSEKPLRKTIFNIAKEAVVVSVAPGSEKSVVIASPLSEIASATAPAEYKFKFVGMNGEFSSPDTKLHEVRQDYAARVEAQVWVQQAQEWRSVTLELAKGDALKGVVRGTKKPQKYAFDAHRQLEEVVWRTETVTQEIEVNVADENGRFVHDPDDDTKIRKEKKTMQHPSLPFKVAIIKDLVSGKFEEYREGRDPEKMDDETGVLVSVLGHQKEAQKPHDKPATHENAR